MEQITVVIPALNEARSIAKIIARCRPHAQRLLVIDGGSTDRTGETARASGAEVVQQFGKGKGCAIRTAAQHVRGEVTVFIDADGSHDPEDIPRLVAPILAGSADHVPGSRLIGGSSELHGGLDEFLRLVGSCFITAMINWRFGTRLSESQNGFRAIRTAVLRDLDLQEKITTIEQEMTIKTLRRGYRMGEVPTHEHRRWYGDSHIRLSRVWWRYGYQFLRDLLRPLTSIERQRRAENRQKHYSPTRPSREETVGRDQ